MIEAWESETKITNLKAIVEGLKKQPRLLFEKYRLICAALKHPSVPWYAKSVAVLSVCYPLSPIQLIPTFIPVIGQLDDAAVITLGYKVLLKWVPQDVLDDCRRRVGKPRSGDKAHRTSSPAEPEVVSPAD